MSARNLVYAGRDEAVLNELLLKSQYEIAEISTNADEVVSQAKEHWDQVLLLDLDDVRQPVDLIHRIRQEAPAAPLLIVSSMTPLPLSIFSVARLNGADGFFWKPLDTPQFIELADVAFRRIARWRSELDEFGVEAGQVHC